MVHSGFKSVQKAIGYGDKPALPRKRLPKQQFGQPGSRKPPMPNKATRGSSPILRGD